MFVRSVSREVSRLIYFPLGPQHSIVLQAPLQIFFLFFFSVLNPQTTIQLVLVSTAATSRKLLKRLLRGGQHTRPLLFN